MYKQLTEYYKSKGISAIDFNCPHFRSCSQTSPQTFTTAKEAFVSSGYVEHDLPRIVFISLDSGSAEIDPHLKTLESIRVWEEEKENVLNLPRNKHWYRTHELAHTILKNFKPDLKIEQARHYFAHINSAKCCMNNPQRAQANQILFDNCREFIPGELEILDPDIIITQGKWARLAIDGVFMELDKSAIVSEELPEMKIIQINNHPVIWIETFHPRHTSFHTVNRAHYSLYVEAIKLFFNLKHQVDFEFIEEQQTINSPEKIIMNPKSIANKKEKSMATSSPSPSMFSQELTYDEIFDKFIEGLRRNLPSHIINSQTVFDHTPNRNRLRIYVNKHQFSGTHYEICFRQDYFEFALHFESTPAKNLERRQAFDSHLNEISEKVDQFVRSGKLENKGWMRIWYENKRSPVKEEHIKQYIEKYSRFVITTYPILERVYQDDFKVENATQEIIMETRSDQKVKGYIPLKEYPVVPPFDKPSKVDCEGYKFMSVVQLCNISVSLGKSRDFAHRAFGGNKGEIYVQADRQAWWWYKGDKQTKKFVLIRAVERFFEEEGLDWK